jgi:hypothetical protein
VRTALQHGIAVERSQGRISPKEGLGGGVAPARWCSGDGEVSLVDP